MTRVSRERLLFLSAARRAGAARRSEQRGRECEQTDCEHDERAVQ
jgi:hypothetical protein